MNLENYIKEHTLSGLSKPDLQEYIYSEVLVENPKELIEISLNAGCLVSSILWWDRLLLSQDSDYGISKIILTDGRSLLPGIRDIRSKEHYFSETNVFKDFDEGTTLEEYCEYIDCIKSMYSKNDFYPSLDIKRRKDR